MSITAQNEMTDSQGSPGSSLASCCERNCTHPFCRPNSSSVLFLKTVKWVPAHVVVKPRCAVLQHKIEPVATFAPEAQHQIVHATLGPARPSRYAVSAALMSVHAMHINGYA